MATIEFLNERIAKAEELISKKQGTIERKKGTITKKIAALAKAGVVWTEGISARDYRDNNEAFWLIIDIETLTEDIERAGKEIAEKQKALEGYKADLATQIEKANSRNIPAILNFLDMWKERVTGYYHEQFELWQVAYTEWCAYDHEYTEWSNYKAYKMRTENREEYDRIKDEYREKRKAYNSRWNFLFEYIDYRTFNEAKFQKDLQRDADAKYDFIIERTNAIVGQITDASNLSIGNKGDLNGFIIGTKGKAKVETIGAGGYNIQCFHFRTLINPIK